jgi:hypothetical protein
MTGFGDSSPGKRPAPTIDGTATEIVEPKEDASAADAASEEPKTEAAGVTGEPRAKTKAPPRTSMPELKTFVTHLAAGLLGGLIAVLALSLLWNKLPSRSDAATSDLTKIEQRIGALESAPKGAGDSSALDARIKTLETEKAAPAPAPDLSELTGRVARLEESLRALGETASAGGSVTDAAALDAKVGDLEQKLQARIDAKLAEGDASEQQSLDDMKKEIADLNAKIAALSVAERSADKEAAVTQSAASVLAFANLRAGVDSGRPYETELASLRSLAPGIGNFGALPAFAEQGIPTLAELTTSFKAASDAAIEAVPTAATPQDDSFFGSVLQSAKSMVKVRRIDGGATGNDPDAVLARAGAKLKQGDLVAAIQDAEGLQGPPRQALASWIDAARARASAEDTLSRLETDLRQQAEAVTPAQTQSP